MSADDYIAGRDLSEAHRRLLTAVTEEAKRTLGADPGRCAQFEQVGAMGRDAFREQFGVDPRANMETVLAVLATTVIAVFNVRDLCGRADSPVPAEAMEAINNITGSVFVTMAMAAGIEMGPVPVAPEKLAEWYAERERQAAAEREFLRETEIEGL